MSAFIYLLGAVAVLALTILLIVMGRRRRRANPVPLRRASDAENPELARLYAIDQRYERFTKRILRAAAVIALTNVVALALGGVALHKQAKLDADQREGRAIALTATCAALSAVIDAGRATIAGGTVIKPPEFARALERLGLPPEEARRAAAESAGRAYGALIARRVAEQTGRPDVVRKDGTLNCAKLRAAVQGADVAVPSRRAP